MNLINFLFGIIVIVFFGVFVYILYYFVMIGIFLFLRRKQSRFQEVVICFRLYFFISGMESFGFWGSCFQFLSWIVFLYFGRVVYRFFAILVKFLFFRVLAVLSFNECVLLDVFEVVFYVRIIGEVGEGCRYRVRGQWEYCSWRRKMKEGSIRYKFSGFVKCVLKLLFIRI